MLSQKSPKVRKVRKSERLIRAGFTHLMTKTNSILLTFSSGLPDFSDFLTSKKRQPIVIITLFEN
jgi:hypothetical protein